MARLTWKLAAAAAAMGAGLVWGAEVPRPAPPFSVPTPDGQQLSLQNLRGKVVLLEFLLTDWPHCQNTARVIGPLYNEWKGRGLEVMAVAINADAKQQIPVFRQRFAATYPMGIGSPNLVKEFAEISAVRNFYVPYIFLLDRKGVIRFEHEGTERAFYDNQTVNLRTEVDALLREPAPPARKTSGKSPPKTAKAPPKS